MLRYYSIIKLDATYNLKGERKDERIGQVANGLEDRDVLHEGAVPYDTEKESADEHNEYKGENLGENFGPGLSFGNLLNHLLHVDIFF
jgi:hypothetical protein